MTLGLTFLFLLLCLFCEEAPWLFLRCLSRKEKDLHLHFHFGWGFILPRAWIFVEDSYLGVRAHLPGCLGDGTDMGAQVYSLVHISIQKNSLLELYISFMPGFYLDSYSYSLMFLTELSTRLIMLTGTLGAIYSILYSHITCCVTQCKTPPVRGNAFTATCRTSRSGTSL